MFTTTSDFLLMIANDYDRAVMFTAAAFFLLIALIQLVFGE